MQGHLELHMWWCRVATNEEFWDIKSSFTPNNSWGPSTYLEMSDQSLIICMKTTTNFDWTALEYKTTTQFSALLNRGTSGAM